jgi:hypothetical protein
MGDRSLTTEFYVAIDYRTKHRLGVWSALVPAATSKEAGELAENLLRRQRRAVVRIDRVVVR